MRCQCRPERADQLFVNVLAPGADRPAAECERFYTVLSRAVQKAPGRRAVCLVGDLNAHLGPQLDLPLI